MLEYINRYTQAVDDHLKKLREQLLFSDTRLSALLPPGTELTDTEKALWITDRLLFSLMNTGIDLVCEENINIFQAWIYGSIHFLLENCPESDHTIAKLAQIISLPQETRFILFHDKDVYPGIRTSSPPTELLNNLNQAVMLIKGKAALSSRATKNGLIL